MDPGYVNSGPVAAKRLISLCLAPVYNSGTGQNVAGVQYIGRSLSCRGWLMSVKHRVHIVKRYAFGLLYYELLNIPVLSIFPHHVSPAIVYVLHQQRLLLIHFLFLRKGTEQ